jgi:hypothetical protein
MQQEQWLLLYGGGISLVTAILTGVASFIFQLIKANIDRRHAIEDEKRNHDYQESLARQQREREKRLQRLGVLEDYIHEAFEITNATGVAISNGSILTKWEDLHVRKLALYNAGFIMGIISEYGDRELGKYFLEVFSFMDELNELVIKSKPGEKIPLSVVFEKHEIGTLYGKIIKKIDDLSIL